MRELLDPEYIATRMQDIDPAHATPSASVKPGEPTALAHESPETTHFSGADDAGNPEAGTAWKRIRRPSGSSSTPTMPLAVSGGSLSVTVTPAESSPRKRSGMSWPGLCRYQK